jgi:hypothetical protein
MGGHVLLLPRAVVRDVVLLEFLRDVVRLRLVRSRVAVAGVDQHRTPLDRRAGHALLPHKVARETDGGDEEHHEIEDPVCPQPRHHALVLDREADRGCDDDIEREEAHCKSERAGYG